jgi:hypothetical protein
MATPMKKSMNAILTWFLRHVLSTDAQCSTFQGRLLADRNSAQKLQLHRHIVRASL